MKKSKVDIKQLNKVINEISTAQRKRRERNESEFIEKEVREEELEKFHLPSTKKIEQVKSALTAIESSRSDDLLNLQRAITEGLADIKTPLIETQKTIRDSEEQRKSSPVVLDPDLGIDLKLLDEYDLTHPSKFKDFPNPDKKIDEDSEHAYVEIRRLIGRMKGKNTLKI